MTWRAGRSRRLTRARTQRIASGGGVGDVWHAAAWYLTDYAAPRPRPCPGATTGSSRAGAIQWAVDQQPYLKGYEAVDSLWLYLANGNILGGGQAVLTGPSFIDAANVAKVAQYAARGTR